MRLGIVIHGHRPDAMAAAHHVVAQLASCGAQVLVEDEVLAAFASGSVTSLNAPDARADVILSLGGDGTLLRGAQYALSWDAALLGVNLGRVGFLAEGEADAINDVVMSRGGYARLITVTALVDGELAGHYIADGLVVATPTGSTGYSLSAGGPIISPKVDCMVLTPICAHSLQHRPTVVQGSAQIRLLLGSDAPQSACLQVDGQTYAQLDDGAVVEISRADRTLQLIRTSDQPFFNLVREKLTEWTR